MRVEYFVILRSACAKSVSVCACEYFTDGSKNASYPNYNPNVIKFNV